jgi:N-dimethylarginine dimethylaminohydrolase
VKASQSVRSARKRTYLLCEPRYFTVAYEINAWMDASKPVDIDLAYRQWTELKRTYEDLGHTVHVLDPVDGLPDMVFAANGAFSVGGKVYGAKFKHPERFDEAPAHAQWYDRNGWTLVVPGQHTNEGEGDFTFIEQQNMILAGYGFRTEVAAHAEAQEVLGRPVISLHLVRDRFYHLDVALFALDDGNICYLPEAFSEGSQKVLRRLFPEALIATEDDALAFGLNAVSDGYNVVIPQQADALGRRLTAAGYNVIPIDLSELHKAGGSVKCCTAELRS